MLTVLSLVTSVKDYIEIAHKLVETQASTSLLGNGVDSSTLIGGIKDYTELGSILTYVVFSIKEFLTSFFTLSWLKNIWSLPLIVPDIASAMISEISVLDSYFTNSFSFLESGLNTANMNASLAVNQEQNSFLYGFEKFLIGFLNSLFLFLPTSTSHLITVRRFVMQGLEAGYMAGLGTIAGNFLWLASIILGWRFIVIPWLSLDIFRYVLGFVLLVKYLWDSSKELNKAGTNATLEDNAKIKIFALNFLLALTEQTSIYPFISNISFGAEGSILEGFSGTIFQTESSSALQFFAIHGCYLLGILLGSFSLLQFTVWFWENPAFSIYMWMVSSYKVTTSTYYKVLNFIFLYLTMLCAISSIPYFGLDYTVTNPLGLIPQDRMIDQKFSTASGSSDKILHETSFLGVNPTDTNNRTRTGVHARRERWKEGLINYQGFDASLYDQGTYDILSIEDLNYGFDRFWLRRKMRNHQIRFRLFPGPWMRSLKKQLNKPGFTGPRLEFFRMLFEQYYHPSFHATNSKKGLFNKGALKSADSKQLAITNSLNGGLSQTSTSNINSLENKSLYIKSQAVDKKFKTKKDLITTQQYSALRKFARNFSNRTTAATIGNANVAMLNNSNMLENKGQALVYSKSLKSLFNKIDAEYSKEKLNIFRNISKNILNPGKTNNFAILNSKTPVWGNSNFAFNSVKSPYLNNTLKQSVKNTNIRKKLSKKDRLLLLNKTNLLTSKSYSGSVGRPEGKANGIANLNQLSNQNSYLQPLNFYFQKDQAFKRKLKYYSTTVTRSLTVGNNAPYFKTMLKRAFYYHKPSLRLKRTLFTAVTRQGFRKKSINPKKVIYPTSAVTNVNLLPAINSQNNGIENTSMETNSPVLYPSTTSYSVLGKNASRYRYQIYKDVLQHWYYTPFNRLLLKFDIDSFINRQPRTHFLTKKEERLLHLRRTLLAEHYNTLRWYTYMQHYRTMKSRIGGSKSFANTSYNQQFQGTFKKIRHLFSITPSQGDMSILKFDQFLFNESNINLGSSSAQQTLQATNPSKQKPKTNLSNSTGTIHEELEELVPSQSTTNLNKSTTNLNKSATTKFPAAHVAEDFIEQSLGITGQYVISEQNEKALKIKEYINQKNYAEITKLLYSNTAQQDLQSNPLENKVLMENKTGQQTNLILFQLLKECKRRLNDQAFLKNYVNHRIDKREQRSRETEKEFKSSLENLKLWLSPISIYGGGEDSIAKTSVNKPTTGVTKALNEGVYILNNINPAISAKTIVLGNTKPLKFKEFALNKATEQEKLLQTVNSLSALTNQIKTNKTFINKVTASKYVVSIQNFINKVLKPVLFVQNRLLVKRSEKNLEWWRQKQRVMAKRETSRKKSRFKTIQTNVTQIENNQKNPLILNKNDSNFRDFIDSSNNLLLRRSNLATPNSFQNSFQNNQYSDELRKKLDNTENSPARSSKTGFSQVFRLGEKAKNLFIKKFRKKSSSKGRRFRVYSNRSARGFAYIKKPKKANNALTIQDVSGNNVSLANLDSTVQDTNKKVLLKDLKTKLISVTTQSLSAAGNSTELKVTNLKNLLIGFKQSVNPVQTNIKKSPIKKNTLAKRTMKRRKRHKFSRNLQKYRKRSLQGFGKLRKLSKKFRRIQATHELRNWWWNNYLPNYVTKQAKQASVTSLATPTSGASNITASYKPLSTNKALEIAGKYNQYTNTNCSSAAPRRESSELSNNLGGACKTVDPNITQTNTVMGTFAAPRRESKANLVDQIYTDLLGSAVQTTSDSNNFNLLKNYYNTTNIPFYAGWDESLRKFVVTNRLLSRRDAGFEVFVAPQDKDTNTANSKVEFTKAPLQGLNEGSFLYLQNAEQLPFNAYILDQFIPTNQSFYAPLGWKRFEFRHSLLKNWLTTVSGTSNSLDAKLNTRVFLNQNNKSNLEFFTNKTTNLDSFNSKSSKALQNRRIKKRYKLVKQTPIQLMYLPSGTLLTEVLPSHYISVFDKQYRFPRNRYLKRNFLKSNLTGTQAYTKDLTVAEFSTALKSTVNQSPEFTLRKRVKPRRKYHKKRFTKKDSLIFPRRYKFGTASNALDNQQNPTLLNTNSESFRLRPSAARSTTRSSQSISKSKAKKRSPKTNPIRLKQLRRRKFQQVYKPLQRFQPRYGGFVWPGDYLRLDIIPLPKLESLRKSLQSNSTAQGGNNLEQNVGISNKVKRNGPKINVQPIGFLPRKYLIQKHNLKVLKKKLALSLV